MAQAVKHLVLLGVSLPAAMLGYHVVAGGGSAFGSATRASDQITDFVSDVSGRGYRLQDLLLFDRDLYYVDQRYVDRDRINLDTMYQAALGRVERQVPGVMFSRKPKGTRLRVSVGTYNTVLGVEPIQTFDQLHAELRRVAAILDEHLPADIDRNDVEYDLINGALSTLDPHSILLPPRQAREMEVDNQGEFGGLGIEIQIKEGRLTVKQPIEGTPAEAVGLRAGDQIVRIEDESTVNMDLNDAVSRLRGEIGTPVRVLIKRKRSPDLIPKTIIRDRIKLNPVEGRLLDGNVGYIVIKSFHGNVADDLDRLVSSLGKESGGGLAGLVLDLRDNPGGYLNQAVAVSDKFLGDGVIVATEEGGGRREEQHATRSGTEADYPIAVLVNGNSASASEIVAGALKNLGRGVVVGERTFGKGSVQHLYPNRDDSSLKLTVARYLTPGDHSIQSIGIPPDVLLQPSIVWEPEADAESDNPTISLYYRDWIEREADLDHALGNREKLEDNPAYALRFHRDRQGPDKRVKAVDTWEVEFARQLLAASTGPSRVDVLQSAGDVVERFAAKEQERIEARFSAVGIDWTNGENPEVATVTVSHSLGADDILKAGEPEDIEVAVTNDGTTDLWRVSAVTESDNPWLDEMEFYFGHIPAGETRTAKRRVSLPHGHFDEHSEVRLTLRDPEDDQLAQIVRTFETRGIDLPGFAYRFTLIDDGSEGTRGDGDGLPELGEVVALEVEVQNTGAGVSRDSHARVKNKSGRPLDLEQGNIALGVPRDPSGTPCDVDRDDNCRPTLAAGASHTGRLVFELRDVPEDGAWALELTVGDNERFDRGTVFRGGFYQYFQLKEELVLEPGKPVDGSWRRPPTIELSRTPALVSSDAVVSGMVRDDRGVQDVVIFHGEQKVFYRGGEHDPIVPFTVEPELLKGSNLVAVIARDEQGLVSTRSLSIWNPDPTALSAKDHGGGAAGGPH